MWSINSASIQVEESPPVNVSVFDRNLVVTSAKAKDILREHKAYNLDATEVRNFNGSVLGYITPVSPLFGLLPCLIRIGKNIDNSMKFQWNSRGYDIAKIFAKKFTHLSPVWLQAKLAEDESGIEIEGIHDIDFKWMQTIRTINPDIKIG